MIDSALQKLLDMALQDGNISDKEREILHRKAKEVGQDIDELDMIIESEISKLKPTGESHEVAEKHVNMSCPSCGSNIPKSSLKCGYCDFELSKSSLTGEKYLSKLQDLLVEASNSIGAMQSSLDPGAAAKKQVVIINTFNMPNDKEHLFELFYFCDGNADTHSNTSLWNNPEAQSNRVLGPAWSGKAKLAYTKLQRYAADDDEVKTLIETYKTKYYVSENEMGKSAVNENLGKKSTVLKKMKWGCGTILLIWVVMLIVGKLVT